jgi:hypothetical protein
VANHPTASANQTTTIGDDDYGGEQGAPLVEEGAPAPMKNLSLGIALDVTLPLGEAAKFISNASLQGLSLDLRYYAWGNWGIGVGVALDSLSKKLTGTAEWENATLSGTQVREISLTPVLLKGYYAWRQEETLIPYVAFGAGVARAVRSLKIGYSDLRDANWHLAVAPEIGFQLPAGPTVVQANARLNYLAPSGEVGGQLFANMSLGISVQ